MSWRIREATGADSEAAAAVVRAVYEEFGFTWEESGYHADLHDLQTHYLDCGGRFWIVECGMSSVARNGTANDANGRECASRPGTPSPQPPPPPRSSPTASRDLRQGEGEFGFPHPPAPSPSAPRQAGISATLRLRSDKEGEPERGLVVATCGLDVFPLIPGVIGEVVLQEGKLRAAGADCSLERLYVHPGARKQGIGAALFERTLAEARELGRQAMEIWSDKAFADAHRLYERYGARVIGDRICDDPDQAEEWGLVLELRA